MKKAIIIIVAVIMAFGVGISLMPSSVGASASSEATEKALCDAEKARGVNADWNPTTKHCDRPDSTNPENMISTILNILFFVLGIASIVMIIYGGIQFISSRGDPKKVSTAKSTVMYAIIGLIVAILALAITNWVMSVLTGSGGGNSASNSAASEYDGDSTGCQSHGYSYDHGTGHCN
ncbi:pilin [Candidatus Saccharibacteria bacterium]|nr:pilin [Candidatus Saccharibacteria bacterium]MCL1963385.1 pilin [Candidatus Saccharibacteria bacterium]